MIEIKALTPRHPSILEYVKIAAFARLYTIASMRTLVMKYNYQLQRLWECAEQITLATLLLLTQTSLPRSLDIAQYIDSSFPNSN
jgi:hypothetical protein